MQPENTGSSNSASSMTLSSIVGEFKDKFKSEDEAMGKSPFQGLDKATVLQETKIFSDANTVTRNPRKCCQLITKLLHILTQGEAFTSTETTDVFFGVTKLFQSKDANLRRMMYLFIKQVAESTAADEVIIVTQSLTRDMNSDTDLYRANSIRVLCRIIDGSMLSAIERYIKQAIVDKNSLVASSALVSGLHLVEENPEIIRRWVNEVQEAMNSPHEMVQYHALSLLYRIKQHDKLAVSKLVTQLQKQSMRSPLALCLLIRYTARLLEQEENIMSSNVEPFYRFLESMLRHKSDMVIYEAARAISSLPINAQDLSKAINVLQVFLTSSSSTLRFAAVRTLNQIAMTLPMIVSKCNEDMESLITDSNRSIATLAITTLLKTGAESSVERLMKQISSFMNEIPDEFKIVVVQAIEALCLKYPAKHRILLNFLANLLRDEGGFDFKQTITKAILKIIAKLPEAKEIGLLNLCEFIEDCEFTGLCVQILHVLGEQGPLTSSPGRYIRFIYNRVILENAIVRASAVSSLTQFALKVESLRESIIVLLQRCIDDDDDEVRDRVTLFLSILQNADADLQQKAFKLDLPMTAYALQRSLEQYKLRPAEGPVSLEELPHVEVDRSYRRASSGVKAGRRHRTSSAGSAGSKSSMAAGSREAGGPTVQDFAKELYAIPEFASLGQLFRSSPVPVPLTEEETEYLVQYICHTFPSHLVLQYRIQNTVPDQLLKDVSVEIEMLDNDEAWSVESIVPLDQLPYGEVGSCYICLTHAEGEGYPIVPMSNELKFKVFECDPKTGEPDEDGFDEDYPLEELELSGADMIAKVQVQDFRSAWEQIGDDNEIREQYGLQFKSVAEGVQKVIASLGLQPCENTGNADAKAKAHVMLLSGVFVGGIKILVKCKLAENPAQGMILQMAVRSEDAAISQTIADCIR